MKRIMIISTGILLCLHLNSNSQEAKIIEPVHKVDISDNIFLELERSENYSLLIRSELDSSCYTSKITNGVLTIRKTPNIFCSGKVTMKLTCPGIREITISGGSEVSSSNVLKTDSLKVTQRSGGSSFFDLDVKYLEVYLTEGSIMSASGYATNQKIEINANATFSAFELEGDDINIEASLGGKGKICAAGKLKAISKIGGYISYKCNPTNAEIEKKGNGVVEAAQ